MLLPDKFIRRTKEYATLEIQVPAPYFRKSFFIDENVKDAELLICGLGFYEVYINGQNITKGFLAPYRSNLNDYVYYDKYEVRNLIRKGKNVISVLLGNGMKNPFGAFVWEFDKVDWRGAPQVAFSLNITDNSDNIITVISDENTKTADSPILFNDLHFGEYYDANLELGDWTGINFDDSRWDDAISAPVPNGECKICEVEPIIAKREIFPVYIEKYQDGYIYDFGINGAGICRLSLNGKKGQEITLRHFEKVVNGKPFFDNICFVEFPKTIDFQKDIYICNGIGTEIHTPKFTYHGFRYVYVTGITEEQAKPDLLTYISIHSDIRQIGNFECSDDTVNKIQKAILQSDITNFHYFPTDCPQREKNGWTADASLSAEQFLLNYAPENSYKEWLRNIYKAQDKDGKLPGIIPTTGWGYSWGNGPAWDNVIVNLPYYTYIYRGDYSILEEAAEPLQRYLKYIDSRLDERNLIAIGLGDWCQPKTEHEWDYKTPLVVTDSITVVDIAEKSAFIYKQLNMPDEEKSAKALGKKVRNAIREHLIDKESCEMFGNTQTAQSMAIYYGIFEEREKSQALNVLVKLIEQNNDFMDTGVLGARVLFRTLADNGYADLAFDMITRKEFPSYGNWIERGATTLWEIFTEDDTAKGSLNHHFWGDVSAWFYTYLAGIRIISHDYIEINPCFIKNLQFVNSYHELPNGQISINWKRTLGKIILNTKIPNGIKHKVICTSENAKITNKTYEYVEYIYEFDDIV